ncbi:unknown [Tannerella sp. CAG:118]|nr:unknown [Tannerella sp. CAG:118]
MFMYKNRIIEWRIGKITIYSDCVLNVYHIPL